MMYYYYDCVCARRPQIRPTSTGDSRMVVTPLANTPIMGHILGYLRTVRVTAAVDLRPWADVEHYRSLDVVSVP